MHWKSLPLDFFGTPLLAAAGADDEGEDEDDDTEGGFACAVSALISAGGEGLAGAIGEWVGLCVDEGCILSSKRIKTWKVGRRLFFYLVSVALC